MMDLQHGVDMPYIVYPSPHAAGLGHARLGDYAVLSLCGILLMHVDFIKGGCSTMGISLWPFVLY